ncbi:MAG: phosphotransferase, partial [Armatimonadetes bacterium]|nr:phosphotransferase [Armatimonadota bacterium]
WQNPRRRDRAMVMLGALHGRFWARPALLAALAWLPRYTADDFWQALELLERPPRGWTPLSRGYLGQLASGAEMLIAGPDTLIHGSFHPNNVGWRADSPVLLDWEKVAWGPPFADLGRLFTRLEEVDGRLTPLVPPAWRAELLAAYATTIEAVANERIEASVVAVQVRGAMLWELAVDLLTELRAGERGNSTRYERFLHYAEAEADEP